VSQAGGPEEEEVAATAEA
jgi:hypothetical protein